MDKGHYEVAYREGNWQPTEERLVKGMLAYTGQPIEPNMRRLRARCVVITKVARYRWLPGPAPVLSEMVEA